MKEETLANKLELHYYFDDSDDSHTMNAFVRNRCEFEGQICKCFYNFEIEFFKLLKPVR